MKIVLICHEEDELNRIALAQWLASWADLSGIVSIKEERSAIFRRLKRERKRIGLFRLFDMLAFRFFYRFILAKEDRRIEKQIFQKIIKKYPQTLAAVPVLMTASANSAEVLATLKSWKPDIIIARCKVILKRSHFEVPRLGTFVMHPGICPEYRNSHGCFWALAERATDKVGMTLLKIDAGVDTGPVYGYFSYPFDEVKESHHIIQERVVFENLEQIKETFLKIENGTAKITETSGRASRAYGQPWLSAYLHWKSQAKKQ
jgi:methionyl-tRNA formyltransferase